MHLVNGTGHSPSLGQLTPGVVKQDKSSRGSVDTTKTRSDPQRVGMSSGERPIGAAKGKQTNTMALCQTPHPSPPFRDDRSSSPTALSVHPCPPNAFQPPVTALETFLQPPFPSSPALTPLSPHGPVPSLSQVPGEGGGRVQPHRPRPLSIAGDL